MSVETERLLLRQLVPEDLVAMTRLWTDPDVAAFMDDFGPRTAEDVAAWLPEAIAAHREDPLYRGWAIVLRPTGEIVGWLGFGSSSKPIGDIDFAYIVDRAHRRRGYAAEALRAAARFCFDRLGARSFWVECHVHNTASALAIQAAGLRFVGTVADQHRFLIESTDSPIQWPTPTVARPIGPNC
jgi:RimJ/RimL family protein N-acetyltransferase